MTNVPILVVSCDRYADLWRPFFSIFFKQWPDCPFQLYLGTNHKVFHEPGVKTINIGDDTNWASGVRTMLKQIGTANVILFLEDFFLTEHVDTQAVERLVGIAIERNTACLRLAPLPAPTPLPTETIPGYPDIGIVEPGTPYRVSAQAAVWRTDVLMKLLVPGFSAWDFEHLGTAMSNEMHEQFLGPLKAYVIYDHAVEKGKWKPEGLRICTESGIVVDFAARNVFTVEELAAHYSNGVTAATLHKMKESAFSGFMNGDRATGAGYAFRCLTKSPFSLQPWGILFFGMLGPGPLRWLRRIHLRQKIKRIRITEGHV